MELGEDVMVVTVLDWDASVAFSVGVTPVRAKDTEVVVVDVATILNAVVVADVSFGVVVCGVSVVV